MKRNSFYHLKKTPDWSLMEMENIEVISNLPSVGWNMMNLENPLQKHKEALKKLKSILYPS